MALIGNDTLPMYCDMFTGSGGWTPVWSYRFTIYDNFASYSNAVTYHATWTSLMNFPSVTVPIMAIHQVLWSSVSGSRLEMKFLLNATLVIGFLASQIVEAL